MTKWLLSRFVKDYNNARDSAVRTRVGNLAGRVGVLCNLVLVFGKLTVGFVSGSVSIIADGINNLLDMTGSFIALAGFRFSAKRADKEHPFGHGRYEYISALVVALLVTAIGIELGKSSIAKIIAPEYVFFGFWSFIVLGASALLKTWMAVFNQKLGCHIGSTVLKATSADSRNDAVATTAVLLSAVLSRFSGVNLDGWAGLGVAVFIVYNGIGLIRDTLNPLLGEAPPPELVEYIYGKIASYKHIIGAHDLIVHDYGPCQRFASAHVEISDEMDSVSAHNVIDKIENDFLKDDNIRLILHHDPIVAGGKAQEHDGTDTPKS